MLTLCVTRSWNSPRSPWSGERIVNYCIKEAGTQRVLTSHRFLEKRPMNLNAEPICRGFTASPFASDQWILNRSSAVRHRVESQSRRRAAKV